MEADIQDIGYNLMYFADVELNIINVVATIEQASNNYPVTVRRSKTGVLYSVLTAGGLILLETYRQMGKTRIPILLR